MILRSPFPASDDPPPDLDVSPVHDGFAGAPLPPAESRTAESRTAESRTAESRTAESRTAQSRTAQSLAGAR